MAEPLDTCLARLAMAAHVLTPITPSRSSFCARWKFFTAASLAAP